MSFRIVHKLPRLEFTQVIIARVERPLSDDPYGRPYQVRNGMTGLKGVPLAHLTRRELEALADALNDELART